MAKRQVYLDHLASSPLLPEVFEAMRPFLLDHGGSPVSIHRHGLQARDALDLARCRLADLIHAGSPEEIIFTASGTEAANLAIKGTAWAARRRGRHLVVTATDHPAILQSVAFLQQHGFTATTVPVDPAGRVRPADVDGALQSDTVLVCVHHANHDLATLQPVRAICAAAARREIPVFVDASASGGWLPLDAPELGASLLSLAPHRFHGPKGVGVLYRQRRVPLESLIHGGTQEGGLRAGTENVPALVGAGAAAAAAARDLPARQGLTARLQTRLWAGLEKSIPYLRLNGPPPGPERLSTSLNVSFEFVEGEGIALMADMQGIAVASGAACVSKALDIPPVLRAIGLPHPLARGNVLFSLGQGNNDADIDYVLAVFPPLIQRLRSMSPAWDEFERGEIDSLIAPRAKG